MTSVRRAGPEQFGFAQGRLVITGATLAEAIPDLKRWYDVDVRLGDPALGQRRLTLESTGRSLIDLQTALEVTLALRVVREGQTITLFPK
jgi:ferric-dicitrate binding protein FerR (iron transport regulator)